MLVLGSINPHAMSMRQYAEYGAIWYCNMLYLWPHSKNTGHSGHQFGMFRRAFEPEFGCRPREWDGIS